MPISIGLPFYNAESFLPDAIRSIFAQSYQDWELILVDDGSTDRSLDIAHSVKDPRVRVLSDGNNRRLAYRLNQITTEARYDFVGRMDADDLISPDRFEKELAIFDAFPEIDLVTTGVCSLSDDNKPVGVRCSSPYDTITGRKLLLGHRGIVHAAILGRKSWFLRNPYDPSVPRAQDCELWLRAFSKNDFKCYILSDVLYYYREKGNATVKRLLSVYSVEYYLYRKYWHLGFNRLEVPYRIAKLRLKSLVVKGLFSLNRMDVLLKMRNRAIDDPKMLNDLHREINEIYQTKVPGLD